MLRGSSYVAVPRDAARQFHTFSITVKLSIFQMTIPVVQRVHHNLQSPGCLDVLLFAHCLLEKTDPEGLLLLLWYSDSISSVRLMLLFRDT